MQFCGQNHDGRRQDFCPSCRQPGMNFVVSGCGVAARSLTDDPAAADVAVCSWCPWDGDAVEFVMTARAWSNQAAALDAIEAWLCGDRPPAQGVTPAALAPAYHSAVNAPIAQRVNPDQTAPSRVRHLAKRAVTFGRKGGRT